MVDKELPLPPCSASIFFLVTDCHLQTPQGRLFTVLPLDGCLHIDFRAPGAGPAHAAGLISHPLRAWSSQVSWRVAVC